MAIKAGYKLICESTGHHGEQELQRRVTEHLVQGWKLAGGPFIMNRNALSGPDSICQAVAYSFTESD